MSKIFKPTGYNSVSPYFIVNGAQKLIDLLKQIFNATELRRYDMDDGTIMHAEIQIDDSVIMLGDSSEKFPPVPIVMHVYVPDVDKTFEQAIAAGCEGIEQPKQRDNDPDRRATFKDFAGNIWSIGTQLSQSNTMEEETLRQLELDWNKSIEINDVVSMAKYMSDEWVIFSGDGNITTKQMFLQFVKSGDLIHSQMGFEILNVKIFGNTGIIMQKGTSSGSWQGQVFSHYEVASTVFIKENDRWLAVQTMIAPATK